MTMDPRDDQQLESNDPAGSSEDQEMLDAIAAAFGSDACDLIDESVDLDPTDAQSLVQAAADLASSDSGATGSDSDLESVLREIDNVAMNSSGAASTRSPRVESELMKVVVIELGESVFGIPMANVHEIQRIPSVTRLPGVPAWVEGVANLRGNILSVVDLRLLLRMSPFESAPGGRRLVVTQSLVDDLDSGFIVDRVIGVRSISQKNVLPPTAPVNDQVAPYLSGVVEIDEALVALLDIDKLMLSEDFRQFEPV